MQYLLAVKRLGYVKNLPSGPSKQKLPDGWDDIPSCIVKTTNVLL